MNFRQLDPGSFGIYGDWNGNTVTGYCFVTPGPNLGTTVEHYVLLPAFQSPSLNGSGQAINHMVIKAIVFSSLGEEAYGTGENGAITLADFFRVMRAIEDDLGVALRYVHALCTNSTGVPAQP